MENRKFQVGDPITWAAVFRFIQEDDTPETVEKRFWGEIVQDR